MKILEKELYKYTYYNCTAVKDLLKLGLYLIFSSKSGSNGYSSQNPVIN